MTLINRTTHWLWLFLFRNSNQSVRTIWYWLNSFFSNQAFRFSFWLFRILLVLMSIHCIIIMSTFRTSINLSFSFYSIFSHWTVILKFSLFSYFLFPRKLIASYYRLSEASVKLFFKIFKLCLHPLIDVALIMWNKATGISRNISAWQWFSKSFFISRKDVNGISLCPFLYLMSSWLHVLSRWILFKEHL